MLDDGPQFVCVDGPEFDGHRVDWDNLLSRVQFYREQEQCACNQWLEECQAEKEKAL
jgi:ferredoxin--NADP+ reductase